MKFRKEIQDVSEIRVRRRRGRIAFAATITLLAAATVLVAFLLVVLRTPLFRVREVRIEGLSRIPEEEIRSFLSASVPQGFFGHLFGARRMLAWPGGFRREELALLPEVQEIDIEKHYFRRIVVARVTEAERRAIWCFRKDESRNCFWFDEEGRVLRRVPGTSGNLILVIEDYSREGVPPGSPVLPQRLFPNMLSILDALEVAAINKREIRLEDLALEEVRVTTNGPDLMMSLRFPAPDLRAILGSVAAKANIADLEYLDLRVERRVYYK